MSYSLSSKAEEDIVEIFIDGAKEFGVDQAQAYHALLSNAFELKVCIEFCM
ncbi:MAG: type II toxin-antitoxin system RelE/ParE family toxin [Candidatus Thioglobus sp.]|jgi:toxin ParE1/3/4|nr:type II toxin-antitoxin system RelE/ParE family toxin [Candidatus Thioglobus sp.]MBT7498106.1 type II toxin-antitoxin system RelE/ParE family toxin [Candidatus Thioglobus sp.]